MKFLKTKNFGISKKTAVKRELAVALTYDQYTMNAPVVSAMGQRACAKELRRVARRYGIPIECHNSLAKRLSSLQTEQELPYELYEDVANVFSKIERRY